MFYELTHQRGLLILRFVFAAIIFFSLVGLKMAILLIAAARLGQRGGAATNLSMRHQGGLYFAFAVATEIENIDADLAQEDVKGHHLYPYLDPFS